MRHFPVFLDLQDAPVLIVGDGGVAARKEALVRQSGATVTVVAPDRFEARDVRGMRLVIAATGDARVNAAVASTARAANVPVNVVDDASLSSFIMPAIVDRSPLVVAISTGGAAPVLATQLRARIELLLDESWGRLALFADRWRRRIRGAVPDLGMRRRFYDWLLDGPVAAAVRAGRESDADRLLEARFAGKAETSAGKVMLVGAGPGDPGLLTLRALRALQQADVILTDRLVSAEILGMARREAEIIDVGKQPGGHGARQGRINRLLVVHARRGRAVVRLKGGDPFIFGRGRARHHGCARLCGLCRDTADPSRSRPRLAVRHRALPRIARSRGLARTGATGTDVGSLYGRRGTGRRARPADRGRTAARDIGGARRERQPAGAARHRDRTGGARRRSASARDRDARPVDHRRSRRTGFAAFLVWPRTGCRRLPC